MPVRPESLAPERFAMALEREVAYYKAHKEEFLEHERKYVVIHGEDLAGFWETFEDALQVACREFGLEPFLIKKIEAQEPILYLRGLPACPS
jgi:hypothetical protein